MMSPLASRPKTSCSICAAFVDCELEFLGWPEDQSDIPQLTDRQVITKFEGKGLDKEHVIREYLWRKK